MNRLTEKTPERWGIREDVATYGEVIALRALRISVIRHVADDCQSTESKCVRCYFVDNEIAECLKQAKAEISAEKKAASEAYEESCKARPRTGG